MFDDLFDIVPDMDLDGDHDIVDLLILDEIDNEIQNETDDSYIPRDDTEDEEYEDEDVEECDENSDTDIVIPLKISLKIDGSDSDEEKHKVLYKSGIEFREAEAREYLEYIQTEKWYGDEDKTKRGNFIVSKSCVASHYLTLDGAYLYAQAIKDNFTLTFDIPDEWDEIKTSFDVLLQDLVEDNVLYAMDIWEWCLDEFMPYIQYANYKNCLTHEILLCMDDFIDEFPGCIIDRIDNNPAFAEKLILKCTDTLWNVEELIVLALEGGHIETAKKIIECAFANQILDIHGKVGLIKTCIEKCSNWEELETMELFQEHIFTIVFAESDVRIKNKILRWQNQMREYIERVERVSPKYAYSRINAWREKYRDSDLDPTRYSTEQDYLTAVRERKYLWRRFCNKRYGVSPEDYETREEYQETVDIAIERETQIMQELSYSEPIDMKTYRFCKVSMSHPYKPYYYYLTGGLSLEIGDMVIVPFGRDNVLTQAQVVAIGEACGCTFPCDVGKIKTVVKKSEPEE